MAIFYINRLKAVEGQGDVLVELLESYNPLLRAMQGFFSQEVFQSLHEPEQIIVIERWKNKLAHLQSTQNTPVGIAEKLTRILAERPTGDYYQ